MEKLQWSIDKQFTFALSFTFLWQFTFWFGLGSVCGILPHPPTTMGWKWKFAQASKQAREESSELANLTERKNKQTYSRFSRRCTARGSSTGLCCVGPAKVKASKSVLFTEGSPELKIKNVCLI